MMTQVEPLTAEEIKTYLPKKKWLVSLAKQAGLKRVLEFYLPVAGVALPWWALKGVAQKLPPDATATVVEFSPREVWRWDPVRRRHRRVMEVMSCVDFRYRNGHVMFIASSLDDFPCVQEGLRFRPCRAGAFDVLVPWEPACLPS